MNLPLIRGKKWNYLAVAFALPVLAVLCLMIAVGCTPFGTKSMLYSDMWHQYFPFFKAFREALRNGDSLLFNWNVGMGLDYLGLISYYLASPLNLLSVLLPDSWVLPYFQLLVPIKMGFASLFFAIFLKKLFSKDDLSIALFGSFYALCSWALGYQWNIMWLDSFALLPLVALGTIRLLRDKKYVLYTLSLCFAILVNYYVGFFVCIFVLLIFICYQISRWTTLKRFGEDFLRIGIFTVIAIGMTAILEIPTLAALGNTQSGVNSFPDGFSLNIVKYADCAAARDAWNVYKQAVAAKQFALGHWLKAIFASIPPVFEGIRQVAGNIGGGISPTFKEGLPNIYSGVGTVVLAVMFLTSRDIKRRERYCALGLLLFIMVSFVVRQLDYIWHGFHFTNMIPYRFSFLFSFLMLYMAYRAYVMWDKFKVWQVFVAGALGVILIFQSGLTAGVSEALKASGEMFGLIFKTMSPDSAVQQMAAQSLEALYNTHGDAYVFLVFNVVFLLLYLILLLYPIVNKEEPVAEKPKKNRKEKKKRKEAEDQKPKAAPPMKVAATMLAVVMVLELVMNVVNFGVSFSYTNLQGYPRGEEYTESMIRYMKEREDELFYRAEATHAQTLNDGALNNYNGISTFTSSANVKVTEFMRVMGYGAKNTYNRYCFEESSPVANLFLNLKYMLERDGKVESNAYFESVHSYGNVYLLENKAYLPLGFLAEPELAEYDFFASGMPAFTLQNGIFTAATGVTDNVWLTNSGSKLEITGQNVTITSSTQTGFCNYKSTGSGKLNYRYEISTAGFFCLDLNMPERNSFNVYLNGKHLYSESLTLPQTLAVCDVVPGDVVEVKVSCKANEDSSMTIRGAIMDDAVFQDGYDVLSASTLKLTEFSGTKIVGTISCNRDGLLYTSIPYDGNWKATVDGKEVEVRLVGDVMVALDLTEGEHEIVFTYVNTAFNSGLLISLVCLLAFLGILYWDHRKVCNEKIRWAVSKISRKK